ncbi:flagellar assembly protein FliH [Bryocella elongata]|uniref:Flagellar assembly protein FliH n=1 Tax=Bryocella elongata TaxID=863522 RepID=A0A1H5TIC9_9BACT|nr:FliH/SctL family protein [Bryocella elongata]SEF62565.1 flagellar assembly protein FliH [Bryocella elongata]
MNTLSNGQAVCRSIAVSSLSYRDVSDAPAPPPEPVKKKAAPATPAAPVVAGPTPEEIQAMIESARRAAAAETEARLNIQHQRDMETQRNRISQALSAFEVERHAYFGKVERDVVELAVSIAAKILHRESQVDPMLLSALARIAIERVNSGSGVSVRVPSNDAPSWSERFSTPINGKSVEVVGDDSLNPGDCVIETSLGSANLSIENQLKEVEQGFFDLLSRRPDVLA